MIVRIGVSQSPKELELDLGDAGDTDAVKAAVDAAFAGGESVLWLADRRGRRVGVPVEKLAYVELGAPEGARIGFGA